MCESCSSKKFLLVQGKGAKDAKESKPQRVCRICSRVLTKKEERQVEVVKARDRSQELLLATSRATDALVDVYFLDGSYKTVGIDESTTVGDLAGLICFSVRVALFQVRQDIFNQEQFRLLDAKLNLQELLHGWVAGGLQYAKIVVPLYDTASALAPSHSSGRVLRSALPRRYERSPYGSVPSATAVPQTPQPQQQQQQRSQAVHSNDEAGTTPMAAAIAIEEGEEEDEREGDTASDSSSDDDDEEEGGSSTPSAPASTNSKVGPSGSPPAPKSRSSFFRRSQSAAPSTPTASSTNGGMGTRTVSGSSAGSTGGRGKARGAAAGRGKSTDEDALSPATIVSPSTIIPSASAGSIGAVSVGIQGAAVGAVEADSGAGALFEKLQVRFDLWKGCGVGLSKGFHEDNGDDEHPEPGDDCFVQFLIHQLLLN